MPHDPMSFASPRQAVELVNRLLRLEDWMGLLRYYADHPLGSTPSLEDARSFFLADTDAVPSHPGGFSRYRRPFPAGFGYDGHEDLAHGMTEVRVSIRIPQGEGIPDQVGMASFYLRRAGEGYRLTVLGPSDELPAPQV